MSLEISPIGDADLDAVASFLHRNLNKRLSASEWRGAMSASWKSDAPNYGFMLRDGQRVVGAYLALYSERTVAGRTERFCNLASWAVHKTSGSTASGSSRRCWPRRAITLLI